MATNILKNKKKTYTVTLKSRLRVTEGHGNGTIVELLRSYMTFY